MNPLLDTTLHAVLEVESVKYVLGLDLFKVSFRPYAGTLFDLVLYTNGDEPCPFQTGDFYQTDDAQHGGWWLTRLPQEDIDQIRASQAKWLSLPPSQKAKRTRAMRDTLRLTVTEEGKLRALRRRPKKDSDEVRCPDLMPEWTPGSKRHQCGFVAGHYGQHWSGVGAGAGYTWDDRDHIED